MSADVIVYASGLCMASACAPAELDGPAVAAAVNALLPTGISSPWTPSSEKWNGTELTGPIPCDGGKGREDAAGRRHWLLEC